MDAIPILLSDAIAAALNTAVGADEFETLGWIAERSYPDWDDDFQELKTLAVDVVFVSSGDDLVDLDSAGSLNTDPSIDISVRKRFQNADRQRPGANTGRIKPESIDPLIRLVEQIHETFSRNRNAALNLASGISANWMDATVRTYCDYGRLREGSFLGVVRLRYNVSKASI